MDRTKDNLTICDQNINRLYTYCVIKLTCILPFHDY
nr:MAG TPA: hypothetical protein [Caudoviricetes sp.]